MSGDDVLAKLISIRHRCFVRGILGGDGGRRGGDDDFRQAFRLLNRLYVDAKRAMSKAEPDISKPGLTRRAGRPRLRIAASRRRLRRRSQWRESKRRRRAEESGNSNCRGVHKNGLQPIESTQVTDAKIAFGDRPTKDAAAAALEALR